jgi:hypothetical protein
MVDLKSSFNFSPITIVIVVAIVIGYFVIAGLSKRRK